MDIVIHSEEECNILDSMLTRHEDDIEVSKKPVSQREQSVLRGIRKLIDSFRIRNSYDFIGPMRCSKCRNNWVAVFSYRSDSLECPKCGKMNHILLQAQGR